MYNRDCKLKKYTGSYHYYFITSFLFVSPYRVLKFTEAAYMKDWVNRCTEGRKKAVLENNPLKKAFYKLIVNSNIL